MTNLTSGERATLQGIVDSEFHDGNDPVGNWVWSFSCNPALGGRHGKAGAAGLRRNEQGEHVT